MERALLSYEAIDWRHSKIGEIAKDLFALDVDKNLRGLVALRISVENRTISIENKHEEFMLFDFFSYILLVDDVPYHKVLLPVCCLISFVRKKSS
jgi:hypothetical protein